MVVRSPLFLGLSTVGLFLAACSSGSPGKPASSSSPQDKAEGGAVEAGGTQVDNGSGEGGSTPADAAEAAEEGVAPEDSGTPTPVDAGEMTTETGSSAEGGKAPPPMGWLALVGGSGIFGQAYEGIPWSTSVVASVDLYSVSCVTNESGWVSGAGGYVAHTADGGWSFAIESTPFKSNLRAINFASQTLGVLAGDGGSLALTTDGGLHWLAQPSLTTVALRGAVIAATASTMVVVGDSATVIVSNDLGSTWHAATIPGAGNLHGVAADPAASLVLAVDDAGNIWSSTDGASSFALAATAPASLDAVALSSDDSEALAVGARGTAMARFGAASFAPVTTGTSQNLHAAVLPTANPNIYVAGDNGTLLTSTDQGAHWSTVPLSISTPIYALDRLL